MTPLGLLNFIVLQWFGVRLQASFDPDEAGFDRATKTWRVRPGRWWSKYAPPAGACVSWDLLRWVWPLTGWWSDYRWISRRR
jgi:hypothetical protein